MVTESKVLLRPKYSIDNAKGTRNCRIIFRWGNPKKKVLLPIHPPTRSKNVAQRRVPEILDSWLLEHGVKPSLKEIAKESIDKVFKSYLNTEYADLKESTRICVKRHLERMKDALRVNTLSEIDKDVFEASVETLRNGLTAKGWANVLVNCRKFLNWCVRKDLLLKDPSRDVSLPPKINYGRKEIWDLWEDERFTETSKFLNKRDRDLLIDLWYTGMDLSDLYELRKKHVVEVNPGDWRVQKVREKAKTKREFINLPISSTIRARWIKHWKSLKKPDDKMFDFHLSNARSHGTAYLKRLKRAQQKAEYKENDLKGTKEIRHTFATRHRNRHVPKDELKQWMGHTPESTVLERLYIHFDTDDNLMD
ncbi:tyrosine-type recombinase/integrase [Fibrobacterota bacterium]